MSGPPRTPREVRRRRGTLRKDRDPAPLAVIAPAYPTGQVVEDVPGRDFIQEVLDAGAAVWLADTDAASVEILRQLWVDRERARENWRQAPGDKDLFQSYNELTKRLIACLSQNGLDPAGRAKLGVAEVKRQSVLDGIEERRARRRAGRRAG